MAIDILRDSYFTLLCTIIIICYVALNKNKFGKKLIRLFMITIGLAVIETVAGSAERFLSNCETYHPMRLVLSWLCYCVAPGILLSVAETIARKSKAWKKWLMAVPEIINVLITSTAFFGPWCFTMNPDGNHFTPGPLIVVPRYSIIIYLLIVVGVALINVRKSKRECITVLVVAVLIAINYIDETELRILGNVRESTIAISILAYFMYFVSVRHIDEVDEINMEFLKAEEKHTKQMLDQSIETLAYTIDAKDRYTKGHSSRVAKYSRMIGKLLNKSDEECRQIYLCGLLHDIGKIAISGRIINKPEKLTDEEYEEIKKHPVNGAIILEKMKDIPYLQEGAKYHHERYDGKGYPEGLVGEDIPEIARIIAVADAYDAMTSYRSYRPAMDQAKVKQEIWKGSGTQFDPLFAKLMISLIDADVYYDMREKPGEQDEIVFDEDGVDIVWTVAPREQNIEIIKMMESGENELAAFINAEDRWANPSNGIEITETAGSIKFLGKAREKAEYVWNSPALLVYASDNGMTTGGHYDELGVIMSAGYSWRAGTAEREYSSFVRNEGFTNWDEWIDRNKAGMEYYVDYVRSGNEVVFKIYNEMLTMDEHIVLKDDYERNVYFAVSGELCDISGITIIDK